MTDSTATSPPEDYRLLEARSAFTELLSPIYIRENREENRCAFVAREKHCNRTGVVHGGMLMAFADIAFSTLRGLENDEPSTSISFSFEMMKSAQVGDLVEARMQLLRRTGSLNSIRGELFVGESIIVASTTIDKRLRNRRT